MSKICLKEKHSTQFYEKNENFLKNFYSKLPSDLVGKVPIEENIYRKNSVKKYYSAMNIPSSSLKFRNTKCEEICKILVNIDLNEEWWFDEILGRFLKDGVELLTKPLRKTINLPLSSKFPLMRNTAKVKSLYEKGKTTEPEHYRPVSLLSI